MKGITIIPDSEIAVAPLTSEEIKWMKRLERTLKACPDRLEIVTIGDGSIEIISNEKESELYDGRSIRDGVTLAILDGKPVIHGVS